MKIRVLPLIVLAAVTVLVAGSFLTIRILNAAENTTLKEPVKSVFDHYLDIQRELAQDSLIGLTVNARAIAAAARKEAGTEWDRKINQQATELASARNLASARSAFKPLSNTLIDYLAQNKVTPGQYYQGHCSMAKASWLQTGKKVHNPYLGQAMTECGRILPNFVPQSAAEAVVPASDAHACPAMSQGHSPPPRHPPINKSSQDHSCCPH